MRKIGSGYASTVYVATCRLTGNQAAIKMYHKNKLSELNKFQVQREIRIHAGLDHKHIIQLVRAAPPWAKRSTQHVLLPYTPAPCPAPALSLLWPRASLC